MRKVYVRVDDKEELQEFKYDVNSYLRGNEEISLEATTSDTINLVLDVDLIKEPRIYRVAIERKKFQLSYINLTTLNLLNDKFNEMGLRGPYQHWAEQSTDTSTAFNSLKKNYQEEIDEAVRVFNEIQGLE